MSEDTSLDLRQQFKTILEDTIYDVTALGSDTTAGQMKLISLFAEQQAKLLQVIEDELDSEFFKTVTVEPHQNLNEAWAEKVRQVLKKLKDNIINGGSL